MNKNLYVVLMAGGVGTRFWPYSRNSRPKQFLDVLGTGKTLLQSTYERFLPLCPQENIFIVIHEEHEKLTKEQIAGISADQLLTEPMRKNTAPCIAYACHKIARLNKEAVVVVSPADHLILNEEDFQATIRKAAEQAKSQDKLITLGIKPSRPETGYGYIQYLESKNPLKKVKTFTEKPNLELAKTFISSGDFLWNSGIFIWSTKSVINSLEQNDPELANVFKDGIEFYNTPKEKEFIKQAYNVCKNISIDYSLMENDVYNVTGGYVPADITGDGVVESADYSIMENNVYLVIGVLRPF